MAKLDVIVQMLGKIRHYANGLCEEVSNLVVIDDAITIRIQQLGILISQISAIVPKKIYVTYAEFFAVFEKTCKDGRKEFLEQNLKEIVSSLELFMECMDSIVQDIHENRRACVCCGNEVVYETLPSYYEDEKMRYGCTKKSRAETLNKDEYLCPLCMASDRDRLIVMFLRKLCIENATKDEKLLHFAPARGIEHWIHGNSMELQYHTADLFMDGMTYQTDIQNMEQVKDEAYDYFICSHVLEHVQDDKQAMSELYRILKGDGIGIFLVPIDLNVTETDEEWGLSEEENWKRFGQGDHCRSYAKKDLLKRLTENGFFVHELDRDYFGKEMFIESGLSDTSVLYVLTKRDVDINELLLRRMEKRAQQRSDTTRKNPLVSVILPTYNHEEYIDEAIESVLNQTYTNIEFLVADDGSSDKTPEHILKYQDKIQEMHLFKENAGGGRGKFLAKRAKGKYIAMMHSDDVWVPEKIAMQVAYMESHPECAACFAGGSVISTSGENAGETPFRQMNATKEQWVRYFYENGNCLAHPSVLARKENYAMLSENTGAGMFRQLPDFWMWLNLLLDSEIHVIEKDLVMFRLHEQGENKNASARTNENWVRHLVEESYIWYELFKRMDSKFFKIAFGSRMINRQANKEEEYLCEKMFILLKPRISYLKQAGIFFMYDILQDLNVRNVLERDYHWTMKDVGRISGDFLME